jgi:hypothetical protein
MFHSRVFNTIFIQQMVSINSVDYTIYLYSHRWFASVLLTLASRWITQEKVVFVAKIVLCNVKRDLSLVELLIATLTQTRDVKCWSVRETLLTLFCECCNTLNSSKFLCPILFRLPRSIIVQYHWRQNERALNATLRTDLKYDFLNL